MLYIILLLLYFNIIIMAKSISGGLGTVNLSVQELRLLGGTFTTLDTTTLTVLGTATLGSLTINGTFTIDQLTSNTIITQNLSVSQTINVKADNDTDDNDNKIIFINGGSDTGLIKTSTGLYYNPDSDTLTAGRFNGNVTGNVTGDLSGNVIASNITTTNITASGTTNITALNNTTASVNNRIPFINGNSTETGVLVTRGNFNYNTSTQTLNCGTFNATNVNSQDITTNGLITDEIAIKAIDVVPETSTYNFDYRLLFLKSGVSDPVISQAASMYFNPSTSKLYVPNLDSTTLTATTTTTDTLNLKAVEPTATGAGANCRLCFFDGASTTGSSYNIVKSGNLYYVPNSTTLVTNSVRSQVQAISPLFVMLGSGFSSTNASIGLFNDGTAVRNRYQHANGHLFMDGNAVNSNNLFMTNTTQTRIYNDLQCDDDVTVSGTLTAGTLNIGTQTATNFSVVNDITVGGDTILSNTPTASGSTALSILLLGSNKIQRGSITFNPLSNILSTTNIGLTGSLSSSILTTTTLTATTLDLSGDLTLTNLPTTITTSVSYSLLYKNNTTDEVHETSPSLISIGRGLTDVFIGTERIIADTFQCSNGLPIGYTSTYNCFDWLTYDYSATNPYGTFGIDRYVILHTTNASGHNPTVTQHGANIFSSGTSPIIRSAFNFGQTGSNAHWKLVSNTHAGIWRVRVSCVFQNLTTERQTPKIYLKKYNGSAFIEQPHISTAIDYARQDVGELVTLNLEGVVYLSSTTELLRIYTLLETHAVNNPPTWSDSITAWAGRDINIQMEFLGTGTSLTGEIINAL